MGGTALVCLELEVQLVVLSNYWFCPISGFVQLVELELEVQLVAGCFDRYYQDASHQTWGNDPYSLFHKYEATNYHTAVDASSIAEMSVMCMAAK
jgi:hypothetical protein